MATMTLQKKKLKKDLEEFLMLTFHTLHWGSTRRFEELKAVALKTGGDILRYDRVTPGFPHEPVFQIVHFADHEAAMVTLVEASTAMEKWTLVPGLVEERVRKGIDAAVRLMISDYGQALVEAAEMGGVVIEIVWHKNVTGESETKVTYEAYPGNAEAAHKYIRSETRCRRNVFEMRVIPQRKSV
jgi:hypothetical protein